MILSLHSFFTIGSIVSPFLFYIWIYQEERNFEQWIINRYFQ